MSKYALQLAQRALSNKNAPTQLIYKALAEINKALNKPDGWRTHDLYTDADKTKPTVICDRNGQVVLGLCKRCGRAEAELEVSCDARRTWLHPELGSLYGKSHIHMGPSHQIGMLTKEQANAALEEMVDLRREATGEAK